MTAQTLPCQSKRPDGTVCSAIPIGPAYAWQTNGRWYFTPFKAMASPDAIEVERVVVDGKICLEQTWSSGGRNIWDAQQID